MKSFVLHPSVNSFDPPVESLLRQMEGLVGDQSNADVVLVPITKKSDFKFNPELQNLNRPYVLVDFVENWWNWDQEETMLFGRNTAKFFGNDYNEEWEKFDRFVNEKPPILTFKRELLEKDRNDRLLPIEYTSWLPEVGMDTKEDFLKRPLQVMNSWGRSHEGRMYFHGAIFTQAGRLGYDVVSEFSHIEKAISDSNSLKWATVHAPHYARIDVRDVQKLNRMAKVVPVLNGCGVKTFRGGEACADAILAFPQDNLAWSYPWTYQNSIPLPKIIDEMTGQNACYDIQNALMRPDLYELYVEGLRNAQNYRYEKYLRAHVQANIQRCL